MKCIVLFVATLSLLATKIYALDPPKGLKWGMKYEEAKTHLEKTLDKKERLELKDLKEEKGLIPGFKKAELKKVKIKSKKAHKPYLVFDEEEKLAAVVYYFRWDKDRGGKSKAWKFHQDVAEIFTIKYGKPISDDTEATRGEEIEKDVSLETRWLDEETNEEIVLAITHRIIDIVLVKEDDYYVDLYYLSDKFRKAQKALAADTDEL